MESRLCCRRLRASRTSDAIHRGARNPRIGSRDSIPAESDPVSSAICDRPSPVWLRKQSGRDRSQTNCRKDRRIIFPRPRTLGGIKGTLTEFCEFGQRPFNSPPIVLLPHHVRQVFIVLLADAFDEVRIRNQFPLQRDGPRFRIGLRIVDRHLDLHASDIRTCITFRHF